MLQKHHDKPVYTCRDHPEKKIDFTVLREGQITHIPVTPALAADGSGRIGVSLAVNAKIVRKAANGLGDAAGLAAAEFSRLTGIVVGGELSVFCGSSVIVAHCMRYRYTCTPPLSVLQATQSLCLTSGCMSAHISSGLRQLCMITIF